MKRKQKRFLQMTLLFMVALIFLPNIGLWSLYKDKHLVKSTEPGEQQTFPLGLGDGQFYAWTDGLRRKDWHDYESIQKEAMRSGKGEHGKPYPLTEEDHDDSAYRENGFNIFVSNNIALERSLPDIRHANCKHKMYLERLPNTSIIIPFHNEGWTSLLRTIHSIINRTPESLIAEIILVDDFSDREHLKDKLEEYMARFSKVRIVRTKKREGLIRTRLLGASMARGEVLTFLDSHCEVNVNWLPPLLNQIALNHKTIVCPMIDVIDHNHFGYEAQAGDAMRGAFDWEMYYKRIPIPPELQRADPSDPFESPVMAGGLFAVDRKWFWELGGYDPGLEIWGGEQYEISFKVWMCGGEMFDVPCSRVGHIYRKYVPYKVPSGTSLARNLKRVAETWMDEFAEYIYQRRPEYRHLSTGDISAQKELRKQLKCKDFKWFMAAVAWDVPKYYPPVEPPPAAWGRRLNTERGRRGQDTEAAFSGFQLPLEKVSRALACFAERVQKDVLYLCLGCPRREGESQAWLLSETENSKHWQACEEVGTIVHSCRNVKRYSRYIKQHGGFSESIVDDIPCAVPLIPMISSFPNGKPVSPTPLRPFCPCPQASPLWRPSVCPPYGFDGVVFIRNVAANLCVDSKHGATGTELRLDICVKDGSERTWSHEQLFTLGWREDIRPGEPLHTRKFCFDAISHNSPVTLYDCHGMKGNQLWGYRKDRTLFHPVSNSCVDCNPAEKKIFMARCDPLSETQQWVFEHLNMTVLEKFNHHASS
ncbi:polypeptide N-acetylgalactosaminyltransferase-like 6 [Prionailurus bengalensis]|nr:polypeptide N-acetylgalactosaminyltransferase-like 6 [Prionailurus bengalensis]